jgi:hypothetical protein
MTDPLAPMPPPSMPTQVREAPRPPAKGSCESQRRSFEKLLRKEDEEEEPSPEAANPYPEPGWPPHGLASKHDGEGSGGDDSAHEGTPPHTGHVAGIESHGAQALQAACGAAPIASAQTDLYPHMALPHGEVALRRFEVLGNQGLSSVEISARANGAMTVHMAASAEHAALLDRYLPKLQRRLPERVTTHMRVQEHDEHHDDDE